MKRSNYLFYGLMISSLFLFGSCDKVSSYLRAQFDSERSDEHSFLSTSHSYATTKVATQPAQYNQSQGTQNNNMDYDPIDDNQGQNPQRKSSLSSKEPAFNSSHQSNANQNYFLRGNDVSLMPIRGQENNYLLTMNGVGDNVILFGNNSENTAYTVDIGSFLDQWGHDSNPTATFIIFRNDPKKIQRDVATTLTIMEPRYDQKSQSVEFIVIPQDEIRTKFVGNNLGSCAIFIQF